MEKYKNKDIIERFKKVGRALYQRRLENSHSGNLSVRIGNRILITRRGSQLGFLEERDIIETGLEVDDSGISLASSEIGVHRAIYKGTTAQAIVHTHQIAAVALSFVQDEIIPIDTEASYILRKVPVISCKEASGSKEMEEKLPKALKDYKIVVLRAHGAFARGKYLEEAWHYSEELQNAAQVLYMVKTLGVDVKKLMRDGFETW